MVAVAWRALGPAQIALVTDAIAALGSPAGSYGIGRIEVTVDGTSARTAGGVLAGSILRMDDAVRNLVAFTGCSLAEASIAASRRRRDCSAAPTRPSRRGLRGDVVLLDDGWRSPRRSSRATSRRDGPRSRRARGRARTRSADGLPYISPSGSLISSRRAPSGR
jgi:N-acetylglucosamine-6-phosphate deacetylase